MSYCNYGQTESDSRGTYMRCPKDCGCNEEMSKTEYFGHYVFGSLVLGFIGLLVLMYEMSTYIRSWLGN